MTGADHAALSLAAPETKRQSELALPIEPEPRRYVVAVSAQSSRPWPVTSQPLPVAERIAHNSAWFASSTSRPVRSSSSSTTPAARNPLPREEYRLGPVLNVVLDPVDDALRFDAGRVIRDSRRLGHRGVEPLAAEVRRAELVELVVEPGRVHHLNLPDPVPPQRHRGGRAAGNGRDVKAL